MALYSAFLIVSKVFSLDASQTSSFPLLYLIKSKTKNFKWKIAILIYYI